MVLCTVTINWKYAAGSHFAAGGRGTKPYLSWHPLRISYWVHDSPRAYSTYYSSWKGQHFSAVSLEFYQVWQVSMKTYFMYGCFIPSISFYSPLLFEYLDQNLYTKDHTLVVGLITVQWYAAKCSEFLHCKTLIFGRDKIVFPGYVIFILLIQIDWNFFKEEKTAGQFIK